MSQKLLHKQEKDSVTITTNVASRRVDVIMGSNIKFQVLKKIFTILVFIKMK